jgi:hypothetical protein
VAPMRSCSSSAAGVAGDRRSSVSEVTEGVDALMNGR